MVNYDSFLLIYHFKGYGMGGFGGALKQLSWEFLRSKLFESVGGKE